MRAAHLHGDLACHLQDLAVQQEEARQAVVADQLELLRQPPLRLAAAGPAPVAAIERGGAQPCEFAVGAVVVGRRIAVAEVARQVEGAALGQGGRLAHGLGHVREQRRHLGRRLEHVLAVAAALPLAGLERTPDSDRHERVLQRRSAAVVRVHVVGGDGRHAELTAELAQAAQAGAVAAPERALQLDPQSVRAEGLAQQPPAPPRRLVGRHQRPVAGTAAQADQPA